MGKTGGEIQGLAKTWKYSIFLIRWDLELTKVSHEFVLQA